MIDPQVNSFPLVDVQVATADSPINETTPSLVEVGEAVARLKGGQAGANYSIRRELLNHADESVIRGLHVLNDVLQSNTIPPDWKKGLVVPFCTTRPCRWDIC